jgi:hypothetical protein
VCWAVVVCVCVCAEFRWGRDSRVWGLVGCARSGDENSGFVRGERVLLVLEASFVPGLRVSSCAVSIAPRCCVLPLTGGWVPALASPRLLVDVASSCSAPHCSCVWGFVGPTPYTVPDRTDSRSAGDGAGCGAGVESRFATEGGNAP